MRVLLMLFLMSVATQAAAQELLLLAGTTHDSGLDETSYAWGIEYDHRLSEHAYLSLGWINEGHLDGHHRDGPLVQIAGRIRIPDSRLVLSLGLGPYAYFDTALAGQGATYANDHGYGLVYSAGLSWYSQRPWFFQLRVNRIETDTHIDTTRLLLGVGYRLEAPNRPRAEPAKQFKREEVTVFAGRTVLNSFQSENSFAMSVEYRRGIGRNLDWTVAWLHEGGNHIIRRDGVTTQLWVVRAFPHLRLVLGAGGGAYYAINKEHLVEGTDNGGERVSGIITLSAGYVLNTHWLLRLSWNRVVTGYSRDTDVFLIGSGYRF